MLLCWVTRVRLSIFFCSCTSLVLYRCVYLLFEIITWWCVVLQIWVWIYSCAMRLFLGRISRSCLKMLAYFIWVIKWVKVGMRVNLKAVCNSWSKEVCRVSPRSKLLWSSTVDLSGKKWIGNIGFDHSNVNNNDLITDDFIHLNKLLLTHYLSKRPLTSFELLLPISRVLGLFSMCSRLPSNGLSR